MLRPRWSYPAELGWDAQTNRKFMRSSKLCKSQHKHQISRRLRCDDVLSLQPLSRDALHNGSQVIQCQCPQQDLVREVAAGAALKTNNHRIFKLEDIAMGSWVEYTAKEKGWGVKYMSYGGFNYIGCSEGDVVSHYIKPAQARCIFSHKSRSCCLRRRLFAFHL